MYATIKQAGARITGWEEGVTFDREPDLDNANVGMPDMKILGMIQYIKEVTKSVASFFVVFGGFYG